MEHMSTKQKIIKEALYLFSEQGYEAVSVVQIAHAVGIKAPSLYKHYTSKNAIFLAIVDEMALRYEQYAAGLAMNGTDAQKDFSLFYKIDAEQLKNIGRNIFLYFAHDEYIARYRKLLIIEQFHNQELADVYVKQYIDEPLNYQAQLFELLSKAGILKEEDPQNMAMHFYGPMHLLLQLYDAQPSREEELLLMLDKNIEHFQQLYMVDKE